MNFSTRNTSEYAKHRSQADGLSCCMCGWPFKVTSSVVAAGRTPDGEKRFKHGLCPSLRERAEMRREALVN